MTYFHRLSFQYRLTFLKYDEIFKIGNFLFLNKGISIIYTVLMLEPKVNHRDIKIGFSKRSLTIRINFN